MDDEKKKGDRQTPTRSDEKMYECFHYGERAVGWDADFDTEDYGWEPGGIVHVCHCRNCGAEIIYVIHAEGGDDE